jgi:hypothetical protein
VPVHYGSQVGDTLLGYLKKANVGTVALDADE